MAVSKEFCLKCQECNRDQFVSLASLVENKFESQTKLFNQKIRNFEFVFLVGGSVFTFTIALVEWLSKLVLH